MTHSYQEFVFGIESIEYLQEYLISGNELSKQLLQGLNLSEGTSTATLPMGVTLEQAKLFRVGGKVKSSINTTTRQSVEPIDFQVIETIQHHLSQSPQNLCIFEDILSRPSDAFLATFEGILTYQDQVYFALPSHYNTPQKIRQVIDNSKAIGHFVGVLTSGSFASMDFCHQQLIGVTELTILAAQTEKIIVGVYDEEGYLIWHRSYG